MGSAWMMGLGMAQNWAKENHVGLAVDGVVLWNSDWLNGARDS
jgi:hypothetical protein